MSAAWSKKYSLHCAREQVYAFDRDHTPDKSFALNGCTARADRLHCCSGFGCSDLGLIASLNLLAVFLQHLLVVSAKAQVVCSWHRVRSRRCFCGVHCILWRRLRRSQSDGLAQVQIALDNVDCRSLFVRQLDFFDPRLVTHYARRRLFAFFLPQNEPAFRTRCTRCAQQRHGTYLGWRQRPTTLVAARLMGRAADSVHCRRLHATGVKTATRQASSPKSAPKPAPKARENVDFVTQRPAPFLLWFVFFRKTNASC